MRYLILCGANLVEQVESDALAWDTSGDGRGTLSAGAAISTDGGASVTHRACNTLGGPIDEDYLTEVYASTAALEMYRLQADTSPGLVQYGDVLGADAIDWVDVGTGDLQTLALNHFGGQVFDIPEDLPAPRWLLGLFYGTEAEYESYEGPVAYGGREASIGGVAYQTIDGQGHVALTTYKPTDAVSLWEAI